MTARELREKIFTGSLDKVTPDYVEVDAETYANVVEEIIHSKLQHARLEIGYVDISVGRHRGPMFHGIEILKK